MPFIFFRLITTLCTVIADVLRKRKSRITKSFCPELKFSPSCVSGTGRKCYLQKWKTKMSFIHIALLQETKNVIEWSEWRENVLTKQGPNYQNYSIIATLISCNKLSNPQRLTKELTYTCRWKVENENWFQICIFDGFVFFCKLYFLDLARCISQVRQAHTCWWLIGRRELVPNWQYRSFSDIFDRFGSSPNNTNTPHSVSLRSHLHWLWMDLYSGQQLLCFIGFHIIRWEINDKATTFSSKWPI